MEYHLLHESIRNRKKHFNTDKWRPAAIHFERYKCYTFLKPKTTTYKLFWNEEKRRCLQGYRVGDDWITGYHYFYLNYGRILSSKVKEDSEGNEVKSKGKIQADRKESFPKFWDGDYDYFHYLEQAEYGDINKEALFPELYYNNPITNTGGEHAVVLKCRRKGFSFKGGSMVCRNYFLIPDSKSYCLASEERFLVGNDGILSKAWYIMSFVDANTAWRKRRDKEDKPLHKKASYLERGSPIEHGYKSEIIGITLNKNIHKIRGIAGKLILFEEGGVFPDLIEAWTIALESVQDGNYTVGLMCVFGTGGVEGAAFEGLNELFNNPQGYSIKAVDNVWEENAELSKCGYFFPNYLNYTGCIDKEGNSDIEDSLLKINTKRDLIKKHAKDPNAYILAIAESPYTPAEATLRTTGSIFPSFEFRMWETKLATDKHLIAIGSNHGWLHRDKDGKVRFKIELNPLNAQPVRFPTNHKESKVGCVTIYHNPYLINGVVPPNIYYATADPYGMNSDGGESLGVIYIICPATNIVNHEDDTIVASYIGRPYEQDDWNRTAFMLAEMYNAKITIENDRGNMIEYARNNKLLHQLEAEFGILGDNGKTYNQLGRGYGVHIDKERKVQGLQYMRDWFMKLKRVDENGNRKLVLHTIYDINLIIECRQFNLLKGNFDRVSALIPGQYTRRNNVDKIFSPGISTMEEAFRNMKFGYRRTA